MNWHIGRLVQTFPIRALAVLALAFGAGSATAVDDLGLFELESNAAQNGPLPGAEDWETLYAGGANTGGSSNAFTGIIADPAPQSIFTGGRKDIQEIEQWGWKDGSVPDKNDITNAYAAAYDDNGDLILYFGADRVSNNGDAFLGFWFFKGVVGLNMDGSGSFFGEHQPGDVLVLVNFPQGANAEPLIQVITWNLSCSKAASNNPLPGECAAKNLFLEFEGEGLTGAVCGSVPPGDDVCAITNPGDTPSPWPYEPKSGTSDIFPFESFFEGGINLSEFVETDACFSSFMAETRSSSSFTAALKDFVIGAFPVCGIELTKNCDLSNPPMIDPGDFESILSTFVVTVENTGFAPVFDLVVTDDLCGAGNQIVLEQDQLGPGPENAATVTVVCDTIENPATNKAMATANAAPGGGAELTSEDNATCPALTPSSMLDIAKLCSTSLMQMDSKLVVRVDATIDVGNTGDEKLEEVTVSDSKVSTLDCGPTSNGDPFVNGAGTLDPGETVQCTGSYLPSAADDTKTMDGDPTDPSEVLFKDQANAQGVGSLSGVTVDTLPGVTASCPLCP
jgi:hypothetical protein